MSGRSILAVQLAQALPDWQIVSDARQIDTVQRPGACILWTEKVTRPAKLGLDYMQDEITLWVLTPVDRPQDIENSLDDLLLAVFEALETLEQFAWTEAERGVLAEKFHGWRVPITCMYKIN